MSKLNVTLTIPAYQEVSIKDLDEIIRRRMASEMAHTLCEKLEMYLSDIDHRRYVTTYRAEFVVFTPLEFRIFVARMKRQLLKENQHAQECNQTQDAKRSVDRLPETPQAHHPVEGDCGAE